MPLPWQIKLLGEWDVRRGTEAPVHFKTRQAGALLAYLALHRQHAHSREMLAEQLWPGEDGDATRSRLRTVLWELRRVLEPEGTPPGTALIAERAEIRLAPAAFITDVEAFERSYQAARQSEEENARKECFCRAIEQYAGPLLPACYEDWVLAERGRLAELYRNALRQAAEIFARLNDMPTAIGYARRAVAADPLQEEAHAALITLYIQAGRAVDAVRQYQELERVLGEQMGLRPSPATRALLSDLQSQSHLQSHSPLQSHASTPRPAPIPPTLVVCEPGQAGLNLEAEGGAVPLHSPFYIERECDHLFAQALDRHDSIVLLKGARQMGKTSLLARGLQAARLAGSRVILTDFQKFTAAQLETSDTLFLTLARDIAEQLELEFDTEALWNPAWGWNVNFERFLRREILNKDATPVVWGLDEVDRLFNFSYSGEVFGLFRSWHNARALNPSGPWSRLTLAMAYATEAHLFITDLNQSPFNVGTRLTLHDFTSGEVAELNRRYNAPLQSEAELTRYMALVGGQPYLVRRGLHTMIENGLTIAAFEAQAGQENGLFADHLRRMCLAVQQDRELCTALRDVLQGRGCPSGEAFFRLQSAGILVGNSPGEARLRCRLYQNYLETRLP